MEGATKSRWASRCSGGHLGSEDFALQLDRLEEAGAEAVVHWGDGEDGARILNQMRERGMAQPFYACDRYVSEAFVRMAGGNAEGVVCSYPLNPDRKDEKLARFRETFHERFGVEEICFSMSRAERRSGGGSRV